MDILEAIAGGGGSTTGGGAVGQLASQFGLKPEQANSALGALLPALTGALRRNAATEDGAASLAAALGKGKHQEYLHDPSTLSRPETVADGNAILGHVLGSKDASRAVASEASQKTGIDPAILKKMLPLVAALAMGGLSQKAGKAGGVMPGGAGGGLAGMLGGLLDRDRDGSMVDDVAGMMGGLLGGRKRG